MKQLSLFENENEPLASRLRPEDLDEFVGQRHLLGKDKILYRLIENDRVPSTWCRQDNTCTYYCS